MECWKSRHYRDCDSDWPTTPSMLAPPTDMRFMAPNQRQLLAYPSSIFLGPLKGILFFSVASEICALDKVVRKAKQCYRNALTCGSTRERVNIHQLKPRPPLRHDRLWLSVERQHVLNHPNPLQLASTQLSQTWTTRQTLQDPQSQGQRQEHRPHRETEAACRNPA